MEQRIERCAGLDVHQATIVATVRIPDGSGGRTTATQTFGTMTVDLLTIRAWLHVHGVTQVTMESTKTGSPLVNMPHLK